MKVSLHLITNDLARLKNLLDGPGKAKILSAMGQKFMDITKLNMGESGIDRPRVWQALSKRYLQRMIRERQAPVPTLLRTGNLRDSMRSTVIGDAAVVGSDCHYAGAHQFGNPGGNLPSRPYFPVLDNPGSGTAELTPYADREIVKVINQEIANIVNNP